MSASPKSLSFQLKDDVVFRESANPSEHGACENGPIPVANEELDFTKHGVQQSFESSQSKATKSVLFDTRSTIHTHSKKVQSVNDCWRWMINGSNLIKVRPNGRTYNRFFSLDEDLSCIRWVPTSKKAAKATVPISNIREVRRVHTTEILSQISSQSPIGTAGPISGANASSTSPTIPPSNSSLDCTFCIIYGDSFSSLDLIASSAEEATIWITGLNALLGADFSPDALSMEETGILREKWLRQVFEKAVAESYANDADERNRSAADGGLDQDTAIALLKEINADLATARIRQKLAEFDSMKLPANRGWININEFVTMFQEMATRPDIYFLLIRFANRDYFTSYDLLQFLECEQGVEDINLDTCCHLIENYEPSTEARAKKQLLLDGMTRYLLSDEGDIFQPTQLHVVQDMTAPLNHYFISSSHNTYLLEDQLRGPSSVEGYVRALQSGCRCVKIDVWDGSDMPVVCHGNTLTTKISFSEVITTIAHFAFEISRFPLIIHLENHCSISQQKHVANILKTNFGSALLTAPQLDLISKSPEELAGKIIISGKKLGKDLAQDEGDVTDEDEGAETNRTKSNRANAGQQSSRRVKICRELSDLITLHRGSTALLSNSRNKAAVNQSSFSLSESAAARLHSSSPGTWSELMQRSLLRVFPNGSRVDSSNFSPLDFWNAGVPMVALNFQTPGLMMDLYDGKFRQNGGCGYVLKPAMMRLPEFSVPSNFKDCAPISPPQLLRIRVISGQQLPRPRGSAAKATIVDPYVLIQIYGIPIDCAERKTRTIPDEGDCPIFEESLEFYIHHPEMALVRFIVLDDEFIGDDFIGQYTIPFPCIRPGYRHVRLLSNLGEALENATLFVHVAMSEKWGGELLYKNRNKHSKKQAVIRMTGIKQLDEHFKNSIGTITEASRARITTAQALFDLRSECGLPLTANMKQCLRVILQRLANCPDVADCKLSNSENGIPALYIDMVNNSSGGGGGGISANNATNLPAPLHRTIVAFEKSILECHYLCERCPAILRALEEVVRTLGAFHERLDELVDSTGLKGKQSARVYDVYGWNMGLITNHVELLRQCFNDCQHTLDLVRKSNVSLAGYTRHSSERSGQNLQVVLPVTNDEEDSSVSALGRFATSPNSGYSNGTIVHSQLSRCTTYPIPLQSGEANNVASHSISEQRLKSILKKSSSAQDITLEGYASKVASNAARDSAVE